MKTRNIDVVLKEHPNYTRVPNCRNSVIYNLQNGEYLKLLSKRLLKVIKSTEYSLDTRLEAAEGLRNLKHLVLPTSKIEQYGNIAGYTTDEIHGKAYDKDIYGLDLSKIANLHSRIEECIQMNHDNGVITPDLATEGNIMVMPNGEVRFMDYDGMQINEMQCFQHSLKIGTLEEIEELGYYDGRLELCNKDIDKYTAATLFLESIFGVNVVHFILSISKEAPIESIISVLFEAINLDDDSVAQKVANLFIPGAKKEFLGEDISRIASRYELIPALDTPGKRRLRRK